MQHSPHRASSSSSSAAVWRSRRRPGTTLPTMRPLLLVGAVLAKPPATGLVALVDSGLAEPPATRRASSRPSDAPWRNPLRRACRRRPGGASRGTLNLPRCASSLLLLRGPNHTAEGFVWAGESAGQGEMGGCIADHGAWNSMGVF